MTKITKSKAITAYKAFNPNWECRGFQYAIGETYTHQGTVEACASGFHACLKPADVFSYYSFDSENKVAVVEVWGATDTHESDSKIAAEKIKIVRELNWHEVLDLVNLGKDNTGLKNSGDWNSGDWNSGNRNSGNGNSGNRNSGDWNSGNGNSGNGNSGDWNSGNGNSGNGNSGDWNSGNGNVRFFCTGDQQLLCFDAPTTFSIRQIYDLMPSFWNYDTALWIESDAMSDDEKTAHPSHETTGGYLKTFTYREMCANGWAKDDDENKLKFFNLPNFSLEKFKQITGIDAASDYERLMK